LLAPPEFKQEPQWKLRLPSALNALGRLAAALRGQHLAVVEKEFEENFFGGPAAILARACTPPVVRQKTLSRFARARRPTVI